MYDHLFDLLQFFECYGIFLDHYLLADQKAFFHQSQHCNLLFLQFGENKLSAFFGVHYLQMIKQLCLLPESLDQLINTEIGFVFLLLLLIDNY